MVGVNRRANALVMETDVDYFAHSENDCGIKQKFAEHLRSVARNASLGCGLKPV